MRVGNFTSNPGQIKDPTESLPAREQGDLPERENGNRGRESDSADLKYMRVAFWMPSFSGGGYERNTALIASEMARRGIQVGVFLKNGLSGPNRDFLHPDVEVHWAADGILGGTLGDVGKILGSALSLRRKLNKWCPDAVFAHGGTCPTIATLAQLGYNERWKTILSIHNPLVPENKFYAGWEYLRIISRWAHAVFGVSSDIEYQLINVFGLPPSKCSTIYNPVDLNLINELIDAPMPENFPTSSPYILSAGRITANQQKGFIDLIDAYALISRKVSEDLVILGEGAEDDVNLLRRRIEQAGLTHRVHLAGYAPNPFSIFARAKLYALASHFEGFGNTLVEALACGIPIVAANCLGGPKEILDNGRFGELVPVNDPPALAEAIQRTLSRPHRSDFGISRAEDFGVENITDEYLHIIR